MTDDPVPTPDEEGWAAPPITPAATPAPTAPVSPSPSPQVPPGWDPATAPAATTPPDWAPPAPGGAAGAPPPTAPYPPAQYGQPQYGELPGGWGYTAQPYGPPQYGQPPGTWGYGYAPQREQGATTALVLGIVGFFCCGIVLGPAAIHEGIKSRRRIRESGGFLDGDGMALAGIILGAVAVVWFIVSIVIWVSIIGTSSTSTGG